MPRKKILKTAVFGTGFMGRLHVEAVRRLGNVNVVAIAASGLEKARRFADQVSVRGASGDYRELLSDPTIDAVHICTPNHLHFAMAKDALEAGKHVLCEKPLALTSAEAKDLVQIAQERNLANCTCHNFRFYPQVQNMRYLREAGELGEIHTVQGTYSQDWLLYDTDYNWRIESWTNGPSRTFADIGTHWCDMVEYVTGLRIASVCADLSTFHNTRVKPDGSVETFAGATPAAGADTRIPIDTEDFGAVLLRLGDKVRGALTVSQIATGRKNRLFIEIFGTKGSFAWDQERPDDLWIGRRGSLNSLAIKDPTLASDKARVYADLPGGLSEGYDDTFKQIFRNFYRTVSDRTAPVEYPTFVDGLRQLRIVEAVLESNGRSAWRKVK